MTPVILWLKDLRNRIAILRAGIEVCSAQSSLLAVKPIMVLAYMSMMKVK
ncbi:hypothetical protein LEP1GSC194_1595 [Leptospira alstonii serovar Sichuan str. 79601]|uniref:Uncharacterized protein n=1 Tax=Leptospira alstonii serovar Sichuan str. 79601 TaxID=1218565 RepID=M6CQA8_9LEPT|nr:hypothetical protein LEP1GSC194_1358 [Leptospira alstonii serovar Sichuan str. 79601]EMJ92174.1 hypothetical protein LEP1GSC194_1932 [Leptospira alstonii serovar Sichuan str. 79601]EMJ93904.1 hypothetical protein LEP1GSC194_1595 [Leptospira alstonii serovar Sichuan str. 79601]